MVLKEKKFEKFTIYFRSDGILQINIIPEVEVTVEEVAIAVEYLNSVVGNQKYVLLFIAEEFSVPSDKARKFLAQRNSIPFSIGEAFVITSLSQKIVGNFYLKFNKPQRPTKIFSKQKEAETWLKSLLVKQTDSCLN